MVKEPIEWGEVLKAVLFGLIGIIAVIAIGYIVIQQQVIAVRDYCQELVNNHTITNMSECNITVQAMAVQAMAETGENISVVT